MICLWRDSEQTRSEEPPSLWYPPTLLLPMIKTFRFTVVPAAPPLADAADCCVFVPDFAEAEPWPRV